MSEDEGSKKARCHFLGSIEGLSQNRVDKWHYVVNRKHRKM